MTWLRFLLVMLMLLLACGLASATSSPGGTSWVEFDGIPANAGAGVTQYVARAAVLQPQWSELFITWSDIEATQNVFDFSVPDAVLATNRLLTPYGSQREARLLHYWGSSQVPGWFAGLTTNQQMAALAVACSNVCDHYQGQIRLLAMDNEPPLTAPDLHYHTMILSSCVSVAHAAGVGLIGAELSSPGWLPLVNNLVPDGLLNDCDWIGFHEYRIGVVPPDVDEPSYLPVCSMRADQIFDGIAALGKPMIVDEFGLLDSANAVTNALYADRTVKTILMMRKSGVQVIDPYIWCTDNTPNNGCYCYGAYSNGVPTAAAQAILNLENLIGTNACAAASISWPFYEYRFGTNTFLWMAEGSSPTGMILSGWSSPPTRVRDGAAAPTNVLYSIPIVLSGEGTIILTNAGPPGIWRVFQVTD